MKHYTKFFVLVIFFCVYFLPASVVKAASVNATDCSKGAVETAISSASNGDTVKIPAGTCTWTSSLTFTKGVTLEGAGVGNTIIKDNIAGGGESPIIQWTCVANQLHRITDIEFQNGGRTPANTNGIIRLACTNGGSTTIRIDHNKFDHLKGTNLSINTAVGVIDHNTFLVAGNTIPFIVRDANWNADAIGYGDASWFDGVTWGSSEFLFAEDNVFTHDTGNNYACTDGYTGARFVVRFNTVTGCIYGNHGTESTGRQRGGRAIEMYKNNSDLRSLSPGFSQIRSGSILAWGNVGTNMATSSLPVVVSQTVERAIANFTGNGTGFGGADGVSKWDVNDSKNPYGSYTVGSVPVILKVTVSNAGWTPNQWTGYAIRKTSACTDRNCFALILSNTSDTITYAGAKGADFGNDLTFSSGDTFEVNKVLDIIDQPGRGGGSLITGLTPIAPTGWNNQVNFPDYEWLNQGNGSYIHFGLRMITTAFQENEHYYNYTTSFAGSSGVGSGTLASRPSTCTTGVAYFATDQGDWNKSGSGGQGQLYKCTSTNTWSLYYIPYVYPHPLVSGTPYTPPATTPSTPVEPVTPLPPATTPPVKIPPATIPPLVVPPLSEPVKIIIPPPNNPTKTTNTYNFGTVTLRNGSRGEAVKELQRFLNAKLNLGLVIDGRLGPKTILVIKKWQKDNGLVADGLIGAKTKMKMNAE